MTTILNKNSELRRLAGLIFAGLATVEDMRQVKAEEVLAIKSDLSEPRRFVHVFEKAAKPKDGGDRVRRFTASTERADRMGDIIRVKGWDFTDFKRNPQALWCHQSRELPIGLVLDSEKATKEDPPKLYQSIDFHGADLNPHADTVLRMIDARALRAVSVGFMPLEINNPREPEEREKLGLGSWGVEFLKQSQLELSVCVIPAHPDALRDDAAIQRALGEMVAAKQITEAQADAMLKMGTPRVFALGEIKADPPAAPVEPTPPAPDATVSAFAACEESLRVTREALAATSAVMSAALERTTHALIESVERTIALEQRIAAIEQKQTPTEPAPKALADGATGRASNAEEFFAQAIEGAVKRLASG